MKSKTSRKILIQVVLLVILLGLLLALLSLYLMKDIEYYAIAIWVAFVAVYSIFFVLFMDTMYLVWNQHELENEDIRP